MRVVTAIDSFKGSLTSIEAGKAAVEGFRRVVPDLAADVRPLADGGEGTVEALTAGMNGESEHVMVTGPLGAPQDAVYGIIRETKTAVIEMSAAAGITLVPREDLNPLAATTYGVGEIIRDAVGKGCRRFIVGIGGSATNDGGVGMLQALGWDFLDADGRQIPFGAKGLKTLDHIRAEHVLPELSECTFRIACDVTNPLCGPNGCSAVYGPQKGATPSMILEMDQWLANYAKIAEQTLSKSGGSLTPGAGAAGGLGFAFLTFLHGELQSGIQIVLEETKLESYIQNADLVVTGEGRLDFQTSMGKAPVGVASLAKKYGKPVIAFAGSVTKDASACNQKGIDAFFPIVRGVTTLDEAMNPDNAKSNLSDTAEQALRLFLAGRG